MPPQPPAWLEWLTNALRGSGPVFTTIFWIAAALIALALLYFIARWIEAGGPSFLKRGRVEAAEAEEVWTIEEAPARALLAEADALARTGRFSEAAHLLLFRSIEEIDRRRPALVRPALTSRDIADAPQLPPGPRGAFCEIAMAVERSLFGGRDLSEADWKGCRSAYEDFALTREWAA